MAFSNWRRKGVGRLLKGRDFPMIDVEWVGSGQGLNGVMDDFNGVISWQLLPL
jgi:hypothetical protein